jgi:hypothetical protein
MAQNPYIQEKDHCVVYVQSILDFYNTRQQCKDLGQIVLRQAAIRNVVVLEKPILRYLMHFSLYSISGKSNLSPGKFYKHFF